MINEADLNELRRMETNLYDEDKARIRRIIREVSALVSENARLKSENAALRNAK